MMVRAADELQALQEERKASFNFMDHLTKNSTFFYMFCITFEYILCDVQKVDPQTAERIDQFLVRLRACAAAEASFTFILDDPAGNSFIENP